MSDQGLTEMRDWVADTLTSALASDESGDFVVSQGEELVLVHIEDGTFYLITVQRGVLSATKGTAVSS